MKAKTWSKLGCCVAILSLEDRYRCHEWTSRPKWTFQNNIRWSRDCRPARMHVQAAGSSGSRLQTGLHTGRWHLSLLPLLLSRCFKGEWRNSCQQAQFSKSLLSAAFTRHREQPGKMAVSKYLRPHRAFRGHGSPTKWCQKGGAFPTLLCLFSFILHFLLHS